MKCRRTEGPSDTIYYEAREKEGERWGRRKVWGAQKGADRAGKGIPYIQQAIVTDREQASNSWCTFPNYLKHVCNNGSIVSICLYFMHNQIADLWPGSCFLLFVFVFGAERGFLEN